MDLNRHEQTCRLIDIAFPEDSLLGKKKTKMLTDISNTQKKLGKKEESEPR